MRENVPDWGFEDEFDGGEESCGRVIINLYLYLRPARPGTRVLFISRDPGAPVEFPAWCRLTGNRLLKAEHPHYLFIYKPDQLEE